MRKHIASLRRDEDENEINLTPMLDVVFIMLIFFIVTATFIRETGLDVQRPDQDENIPVVQEKGAILVIIDNNDAIWIDGGTVDPRAVRAHIQRLHAEDAERPVVIQAEAFSTTKTLVGVMDASQQAGVFNIQIVSAGG